MDLTSERRPRRRAVPGDLVSINAHNLTLEEREEFRVVCIRSHISMQDALRQLVNRVASGDIRLLEGDQP